MEKLFRTCSYLLFLAIFCLANAVDVCIVGAGPSGIQAAYSLEEAGYSTVLFEKEAYIGGKTKTVTVQGIRYHMGALFHSNRKSDSIQYLFDRFGIPLSNEPKKQFEFKPGTNIKEVRDFIPSRPLLTLYGILQYSLHRNILGWKHRNGPDFYLENDGKELNNPMSEWLSKRWIFGLEQIFWLIFTGYGYGLITEVPALYVLKYFDVGFVVELVLQNLPSFLSFLPFLKHGVTSVFYEDLFVAMLETLNGQVYLSANITKVYYGVDSNVIEYHLDNGPAQQIACIKMIIAFPQTANSMTVFTPPEIAATLSALTSQVYTTNYYTLLMADPQGIFIEDSMYMLETQSSIPSNPAFIYLIKYGTGGVIVYYLSPTKKTDEEAKSEMVSSLSEFTGTPVKSIVVQEFHSWLYFPHVNKESLDDHFFEQFDELQGASNQYYVGGLFNFETVVDAMAHAQFVVDEYF